MSNEEWTEKLFPGVFVLGHADDTGGNQAVLIDKDDKHYILMTDGFDYGSWIGLRLELTKEERDKAFKWIGSEYSFDKWLQKLWETKEKDKNADNNV